MKNAFFGLLAWTLLNSATAGAAPIIRSVSSIPLLNYRYFDGHEHRTKTLQAPQGYIFVTVVLDEVGQTRKWVGLARQTADLNLLFDRKTVVQTIDQVSWDGRQTWRYNLKSGDHPRRELPVDFSRITAVAAQVQRSYWNPREGNWVSLYEQRVFWF